MRDIYRSRIASFTCMHINEWINVNTFPLNAIIPIQKSYKKTSYIYRHRLLYFRKRKKKIQKKK